MRSAPRRGECMGSAVASPLKDERSARAPAVTDPGGQCAGYARAAHLDVRTAAACRTPGGRTRGGAALVAASRGSRGSYSDPETEVAGGRFDAPRGTQGLCDAPSTIAQAGVLGIDEYRRGSRCPPHRPADQLCTARSLGRNRGIVRPRAGAPNAVVMPDLASRKNY